MTNDRIIPRSMEAGNHPLAVYTRIYKDGLEIHQVYSYDLDANVLVRWKDAWVSFERETVEGPFTVEVDWEAYEKLGARPSTLRPFLGLIASFFKKTGDA